MFKQFTTNFYSADSDFIDIFAESQRMSVFELLAVKIGQGG